jgi:deferrochelatase/peroxidase EfeB
MGVVANHWMELGFGRTSTTSTAQATPRNLLGFKDGTRNIKTEQTDVLNRHVWAGRETDQPWLAGDALNEYIHHTGSAVFAVPPGLRPGQHYGDALFTWATSCVTMRAAAARSAE